MAASKSPQATALVPAARRIQSLRDAIASALNEGIAREGLVLRLTLSDVAALKRDPTVGVDEISFGDAGMRFLGVDIAAGGVTESALERR